MSKLTKDYFLIRQLIRSVEQVSGNVGVKNMSNTTTFQIREGYVFHDCKSYVLLKEHL